MKNIQGYIVLACRWGKDPLVYVGHYEKDEANIALYNGIDKATIFPTRRAANSAVRNSKRRWPGDGKYDMNQWNIIALYTL